jgi:hypothetical protein
VKWLSRHKPTIQPATVKLWDSQYNLLYEGTKLPAVLTVVYLGVPYSFKVTWNED